MASAIQQIKETLKQKGQLKGEIHDLFRSKHWLEKE